MKKLYILIAVIMGLVFAANSYVFAETSVDIETLKAQIKKELSAEKPWNKDLHGWGVDTHGFISQGYISTDDNNYLDSNSKGGSFGYNEIGINFGKQLTTKLRLGVQFFCQDLGAIGNDDVTLDWAIADYRWKDWMGLRVGRIKAPHGLYNESRDIDMLRTSIFLPGSVYTELNRATMGALNGFGFYGDVPVGPVGSVSYYMLAGTTDISGDTDNGAVRQFNSPRLNGFEYWRVSEDFDMDEIYLAAVEWQTPLDGLRMKWTYRSSGLTIPGETVAAPMLGVTAGNAFDYKLDKHANYVYSIEYTWNDLVMAAEYQQVRSEWHIETTYAHPIFTALASDQLSKNHGYYIGAAYRVNEWLEAGTYYSKYYAFSDDKDGSATLAAGAISQDYQAWLEDIALSLRFDINRYWVCKLEGHFMDGAALCLNIDNDDYDDNWYMIAAKLSFSF